MRHQNIPDGGFVRIKRETWAGRCDIDLDGNPLPEGPVRVLRRWCKRGYKEPYFELEGVNGQFRASSLLPA